MIDRKQRKIRKVVERLNYGFVNNILFIHAWSVCNTTPAIIKLGTALLLILIAE